MRLLSFDDITLPVGQASVTMPSKMRSNVVELMDGAYDLDGDDVHQQPFSLSWKGTVISSIQTTIDSLKKAAGGGRKKLVAVMRDGSTQRYVWAKVTAFGAPADFQTWDYLGPISITFQVDYPFWQAAADIAGLWGDGGLWNDSGTWGGNFQTEALTAVTTNFSIDASGSTAIIRKGRITIAPRAGASCSNVFVINNTTGHQFYFSPDLVMGAGNSLIIDLLPRTVRWYNGLDYYRSMWWPDNQLEIMLLKPVSNSMRVVLGGIAGTIDFTYQYENHYL